MTGIRTHVKLGQWGQQNLNKTQSAFVYFLCIRTREGGRERLKNLAQASYIGG